MTDEGWDVVVIGAGAAGLQATGELSVAGKRVALIEGRDRVGGRIWTTRPEDWPARIELGAEFIHGGNPTLDAALRRSHATKLRVREQHWLVEDGLRHPLPDLWERIDAVMKKIGPRFEGSFGDWLKIHGDKVTPMDRKLVETFVEGFQGAPLDRMSARTLFEATKGEEEQFRLKGGYNELVRGLARGLSRQRVTLHLRSIVHQIDWQKGSVVVHSGKKRWHAKTVLVTVPLGVLQAARGAVGGIRFKPELGNRRKLWRTVAKGYAVRIVLRMRADLWRRGVVPQELREKSGRAFGFLHSDETFFPVWWSEAPHPVLVGWTGGPSARKLAGLPPNQVFERAKITLARLLGCDEKSLARSISDWRTHDWAADPLARGAYSYSMAGMEDAPGQMARPIEGTVFFAGEAASEALELGTVHGAVSSGQRAAGEILAVLKRHRRSAQ